MASYFQYRLQRIKLLYWPTGVNLQIWLAIFAFTSFIWLTAYPLLPDGWWCMLGELTPTQWFTLMLGGLAFGGVLISLISLFFIGLVQFVLGKCMKRYPIVESLIIESKEEYEKHQIQYPIEQRLDSIQRDVEELKSQREKMEGKINDEKPI